MTMLFYPCFPSLVLLIELGKPDGLGSVEGPTSDGVEFQVLLECAAGLVSVGEALFLVVNGQEVEEGNCDDVDGEGETSHADLRGVPASVERASQDESTEEMVGGVIWISKTRDTVWSVGAEACKSLSQQAPKQITYRILLLSTFSSRRRWVRARCSFFYFHSKILN